MEVMKQSTNHVNPLSQRETNFSLGDRDQSKDCRRQGKNSKLLLYGSVGVSEAKIFVWECYCACECVTVVFAIYSLIINLHKTATPIKLKVQSRFVLHPPLKFFVV
jgi:hypothetical protein